MNVGMKVHIVFHLAPDGVAVLVPVPVEVGEIEVAGHVVLPAVVPLVGHGEGEPAGDQIGVPGKEHMIKAVLLAVFDDVVPYYSASSEPVRNRPHLWLPLR